MHAGQLDVSLDMARALVDEQFPQWRGLPVRAQATHGTVNAIFRIGDHLAARFPLAACDVASLEAEAQAARELAAGTDVPTPEPVAIGGPGAGYPSPWSVQTWLPGAVATGRDPGESAAFARDLAGFVRDVRAIDTRGRTFSGKGRGGDLASHDAWVERCLRQSEQLLDVPRLRRLWADLRSLPDNPGGELMTHGDLMPGNLLVADGSLAGVLDVGGLAPADPALDLIGAWHLFEAGPRQAFREALGCGDVEWERGRAWAFEQSMGLVWYYVETNPVMSRIGRRTLERIVAAETAP
ncbi:aminoglycoside phosphotransferase family protein [Streptacidiphilus sp. P02-A3a]|nr:aminoglycoside phosphotransferase family protein [Streptacidiphilus sp. P02-A3a]